MAESDSEEKNIDEDQGQQHLELVFDVEKHYDKKVAKALKQQQQCENDPLSCLLPAKGKANIDLKRGLNLRLSQLSLQTDKAILDLLKDKQK